MSAASEPAAGSPAWISPAGHPAPAQLVDGHDTLKADEAYRLLEAGTGIVWRGDFHNARQLLEALGRRFDRRQARPGLAPGPGAPLAEVFLWQRRLQAARAALLGRLALPVQPGWALALPRAPSLREACEAALGPLANPAYLPLREWLGINGAWQWRRNGVPVPALGPGGVIHPHHGVFAPVRGEYVELVGQASLPAAARRAGAFDIGTGTGVLAAVLARRGVAPIVATDQDPRALACARENLARLAPAAAVVQADLFPPLEIHGRAGLVVCNPPWVPAPAEVGLDAAVFDPDSRMLRGFLSGLRGHLAPQGEGWLILSDLAERIGLRAPGALAGWIADAGLAVAARIETRPQHRRARDASDPLHAARSAEVTSLWRLRPA